MKTPMFIFCLFYCFINAVAQGSWDLDYIPIDSLQKNLINKEIRLDFKSSNSDTISGNINGFKIRRLLFKNDQVILEIDGEKKEYTEDWKFYVDHGVLGDQTLKEKHNKSYLIKELFLESVKNSIITVKMNFYTPEKCNSGKLVLYESKTVSLSKKRIKGVLFRRDD